MKSPRHSTIFAKILIVALTPIVVLALILSTYIVNARLGDLSEAFEERGRATAREMASAALLGLFTGDRQGLQSAIRRQLEQGADIVEIRVFDQNGELVASSTRNAAAPPAGTLSNFEALVQPPAFSFGAAEEQMTPNPIGRVAVQFSDRTASEQAAEIIRNAALITLSAVLLTLLIAMAVGRQIARPLARLRGAVKNIADGDFDVRLPETSSGEIGELESGVNKMADAIALSEEELEREIDQATSDLNQTMDALEIRNIELDLARKRALDASAAKSEFLANMSHEIRTPLNGVLGFAGLLRKTALDNDQQTYVSTITDSANTLLNSLNEILDFSKMEAGKLKLEINAFSLREVVSGVVKLFMGQADEKGLSLVGQVAPGVPDGLLGDALRLGQILNNLVSNAVKFTASGEVTVHVTAGGTDDGMAWITFIVADTGLGIPEDAVSKLFEPFDQGPLSTTRIYGGTGLGLNICQRLTEAMGGGINVDSESGVGSRFTVRLPFELAADGEKPREAFSRREMSAAPLPQDWLAGMTFLVADDNPINLRLVETLLIKHGGVVVSAADGKEAMDVAMTTNIDLALVDIHMPEIDGRELAGKIHAAKPTVPVIALTADVSVQGSLPQGSNPFFDFLLKPFEEIAFFQLIAAALDIEMPRIVPAPILPGNDAVDDSGMVRDRVRAIGQAAGSESIADSLFADFLAGLPAALAEIDAAYLGQEWQDLWNAAHRLQGAAAICSLPALDDALKKLAKTARDGDVEQLGDALALVRHEADRLMTNEHS